MLLAYYDGDKKKLPRKIFVHGFFTINGQKMSKTLGNVIDPNDVVEKYGVDGARYLIISQFPFGSDGDIQESNFTQKYNADLANGIGNLASRVSALCANKITDWEKFWTSLQTKNLESSAKTLLSEKKYTEHMENLRLYDALYLILGKIRACDEYLAKEQPWKLNKINDQDKIVAIVCNLCESLWIIANLLTPFLPETSTKILKFIDIQKKQITPVEHLFPRK
jgi:methionyl-tRNA synthetase